MSYSWRYEVNKTSNCLTGYVLLDHSLLLHSHLAHFALTVSSQEGHVVDLIHHYKVLLLPLKVLQDIKIGTKSSICKE